MATVTTHLPWRPKFAAWWRTPKLRSQSLSPLFALLSLCACAGSPAALPEVSIIDSGSTNLPGMRVTFDASGDKVVLEPRGGPKQSTKIPPKLCEQFLRDVQSAGPLDALPANHCLKSASFGSRLYIEFNGMRSPDISCPVQADNRTATLKKEATEILSAARTR